MKIATYANARITLEARIIMDSDFRRLYMKVEIEAEVSRLLAASFNNPQTIFYSTLSITFMRSSEGSGSSSSSRGCTTIEFCPIFCRSWLLFSRMLERPGVGGGRAGYGWGLFSDEGGILLKFCSWCSSGKHYEGTCWRFLCNWLYHQQGFDCLEDRCIVENLVVSLSSTSIFNQILSLRGLTCEFQTTFSLR